MAVEVQFLQFLKVQLRDHAINRSSLPTGDSTTIDAQTCMSKIQLVHLEEACPDSVKHSEPLRDPGPIVHPAGGAGRHLG